VILAVDLDDEASGGTIKVGIPAEELVFALEAEAQKTTGA
jgi:hypothetical protein